MSRIIVDLDGVLFEETGRWDDFGSRKPILENIERLKELSKKYEITIYTARRCEEAFWPTIYSLIQHNLDKVITNVVFDKPIGIKYIDDKSQTNFEEL